MSKYLNHFLTLLAICSVIISCGSDEPDALENGTDSMTQPSENGADGIENEPDDIVLSPVVIDNGDGTGTLNGFEWVDLGIRVNEDGKTRRLVVATKNIGAKTETETGYYFRWGELNGWDIKEPYNYDKLRNNIFDELTPENCVQQPCVLDGVSFANQKKEWTKGTFSNHSYTLFPRGDGDKEVNEIVPDIAGKAKAGVFRDYTYGDAATYNWGPGWRTPTVEDLKNLFLTGSNYNETNYRWYPGKNVYNVTVDYDKNSHSIVLEGNDHKVSLYPTSNVGGGDYCLYRIGANISYRSSSKSGHSTSYIMMLYESVSVFNNSSYDINMNICLNHIAYGCPIRPIAVID